VASPPITSYQLPVTNYQLPSGYFATGFFGSTASTSECGRGITCTLANSPLMALMAWAPASVAANDDRRDERVADLHHRSGEFDVRSFEHRVRAFDERDQAARFKESNCLMCHNELFVASVDR
jgi:hypothetical protein